MLLSLLLSSNHIYCTTLLKVEGGKLYLETRRYLASVSSLSVCFSLFISSGHRYTSGVLSTSSSAEAPAMTSLSSIPPGRVSTVGFTPSVLTLFHIGIQSRIVCMTSRITSMNLLSYLSTASWHFVSCRGHRPPVL